MENSVLKELDLAALREDLPAHGLIAGDVGIVVFGDGEGRAYVELNACAADRSDGE